MSLLCVYNKCRIVVDQIRNSLTGRCVLRTGKIGLLQLNSVHPVVKLTSSAETDTSEQTKQSVASLQTMVSIRVLDPSTPPEMIQNLISTGHYLLTAAGRKILAIQIEPRAQEEAQPKKENEQRLHKQYSELAAHTGLSPDTVRILLEGAFDTDRRTDIHILQIPEDQKATDELARYGTVKELYDIDNKSSFVCHMTPEMGSFVIILKHTLDLMQNTPLSNNAVDQINTLLRIAKKVPMSDPWAKLIQKD